MAACNRVTIAANPKECRNCPMAPDENGWVQGELFTQSSNEICRGAKRRKCLDPHDPKFGRYI